MVRYTCKLTVAKGSSLGPVLADIFTIELAILSELTECIKYWERYVDDMIFFVKLATVNCIITKLNSFDSNIQFTFEEEGKGILPFLDVLIQRKSNSIKKQLYCENLQIMTFTWIGTLLH